jgi:hypothetical protein
MTRKIPCPFKEGDTVHFIVEGQPAWEAKVLKTEDGFECDGKGKTERQPERRIPRIYATVIRVLCPCGQHPQAGETRWFWCVSNFRLKEG